MINNVTNNSLSEQLNDINLSQENVIKIINAIREAVTANKESVTVTVENGDGTTSSLTIPSNFYLFNEIRKLKNNQLSYMGLDNTGGGLIVDNNGSYRQLFVKSFSKTLDGNVNGITTSNAVVIDNNSVLNDLMSPVAKLVFTLGNDFIRAERVLVKKILFKSATEFAQYNDGALHAEVLSKIKNNSHDVDITEQIYFTQPRVNRYYGYFTVLTIDGYLEDGSIQLTLADIRYNDVKSVDASKELYINDVLVSKDGSSKYQVLTVDSVKNRITIKQIAGFSKLSPGVNVLKYHYDIPDEKRDIQIPVRGNEMSLVFIAVISPDSGVVSEYSKSFKIDSDNLVVTEDGTQYAFNLYFHNYIKNIGEYLKQLIEESTIPLSLGIKPNKPYIKSDFFKVMQINKHLSANTDIDRLNKLAEEKEQVFNDISTLNSTISEINSRINAGRYKSEKDRKEDVNKLKELINQKDIKTALYESIVKDIGAKTQLDNFDTLSPKFAIRGFWPIQEPIYSSQTRKQHIIKYRLQYRYLSAQADTVDTTTIRFYNENNEEITGAFSPWNEAQMPMLRRVKNDDGSYTWTSSAVENADEVNINQMDIPIRPGESVEVRIKALSEAGYPVTFLESEWSDIIRIDFPNELLNTQIVSNSVKNNSEDLRKVELEQMFRDKGITEHVSESFKERDKYFAHTAMKIASGFLTPEQTTISVFDVLLELKNSISGINSILSKKTLMPTVEIINEENIYQIQKLSTIRLFAGYYTDNVNMADTAEFGKIVEKVFYIRISNKQNQVLELYSKMPGTRTQQIHDRVDSIFSDIPLMVTSKTGVQLSNITLQRYGQIIYARQLDISEDVNSPLYVKPASKSNTNPTDNADVDYKLAANAIVWDGSQLREVHIKETSPSKNYVVVSNKHPYWKNSANNAKLIAEDMVRAKQFTVIDKEQLHQPQFGLINDNAVIKFANDSYEIVNTPGFAVNDRYLIGYNSCGARLFIRLSDISMIQTNGNAASSYRTLDVGDNSAILIPVVFQYRMADALGRVDGDTQKTVNDNFEYVKKLSLEMQLGTEESFKFDIEVSAKFRASAISSNDLPITRLNSIVSNVNSDSNINTNIQ